MNLGWYKKAMRSVSEYTSSKNGWQKKRTTADECVWTPSWGSRPQLHIHKATHVTELNVTSVKANTGYSGYCENSVEGNWSCRDRSQCHLGKLYLLSPFFMFSRKTTGNGDEYRAIGFTWDLANYIKFDKETPLWGCICFKAYKSRLITKTDKDWLSVFRSSISASLGFVDCHNSKTFLCLLKLYWLLIFCWVPRNKELIVEGLMQTCKLIVCWEESQM